MTNQSKISRPAPPVSSFFSNRRNAPRPDYAHMQNGGGEDPAPVAGSSSTVSAVPARNSKRVATAAAFLAAASTEDTIMVDAPPGHVDFDSEDEMEETIAPTFVQEDLTNDQRAELVMRWSENKAKHERKKRMKSSHVRFLIPFTYRF